VPAVYRPNLAAQLQRQRVVAAPPVYRPARPGVSAPAAYRPSNAAPLQRQQVVAAPPVYRPARPGVSAPAAYRPNNAAPLQRQRVVAALPVYRPARPGVSAPAAYRPNNATPPSPRGRDAVQRLVNWASLTKTKDEGFYAVDKNAPSTLYGRASAPAPLPRGLYLEETDKDETGENVLKWTPNALFISKDQKDVLLEDERGLGFVAKKYLGWKQGRTLKEISELESEIRQKVEARGSSATGVLGPNDCRGWATQLRLLIAESLGVTQDIGTQEVSVPFDLTAEENFGTGIKVGDTMVQTLGQGSSCGYHAATVVAKDSKSLVTLEAHAAKDIDRPEFHIRAGLEGFIHDNNEGQTYLEDNGMRGQIYKVALAGPEAVASRKKQKGLEEIYQDEIVGETLDPQAILRRLAAFKVIETGV
jgi:hypothetical protein